MSQEIKVVVGDLGSSCAVWSDRYGVLMVDKRMSPWEIGEAVAAWAHLWEIAAV